MFKLQISQSNIEGLVKTIADLKHLLVRQENFINDEITSREDGDKQIIALLNVVNGGIGQEGSFRKAVDDLKLEIDTAQVQFAGRVNTFHTSILKSISGISKNIEDINTLIISNTDDVGIEELNTKILSETNARILEDSELKTLIATLDGRVTSGKKLKTIDEEIVIDVTDSILSVRPLFKPEVILNYNTCRVKIEGRSYDFDVIINDDKVIIDNDLLGLDLPGKFAKLQYTTFI